MKPYDSAFIYKLASLKGLVSIAVVDNMPLNMRSCTDVKGIVSKSILRELLLKAARRRLLMFPSLLLA